MNSLTAKPQSLKNLLLDELRMIFDSEMQKVDVLWNMAEAETAPKLSKTFKRLWDKTLDNIHHLQEIFGLLEASVRERPSEERSHARRFPDIPIKKKRNSDEELLSQADRTRLREIALTARTQAALMGHSSVAGILQEILKEEQETEQRLSQLTQRLVHGHVQFEQSPIDFPGFGFRELQPELRKHPVIFDCARKAHENITALSGHRTLP